MKIAYISNSFFSDNDIPLLNELSRKGIDITYYLIMSDRNKSGAIINAKSLKKKPGIYPASEYESLCTLSNLIDISIIRIVNMSVPHNYSPQTFLLSYRFKKELKKENFDLIHLSWPLDYPFYLLYFIKKPIILTVHDPIPHSNNVNLRENIKRLVAIKKSNRFILLNKCQSHDFISRYGLSPNKVSISKLSIYTHLQKTKQSQPIYIGEYILFTGFISPYKGLKYIVEAIQYIKREKSYKNIKLIIAGRGTPDFDLNPYIQNGSVIFINRYIRNEELASLIANSKFVCCPYIDATQSGVIMSAFALYKPVLATNVGALSEMIENGKTGLLVNPRDSRALAEASIKLLTDDILEKMSQNIKQEFSTGNNSWMNIANDLIRIYNITLKEYNDEN